MIPLQEGEPYERDSFDGCTADYNFSARCWPTVAQIYDAIAPMTADTVLQILRADARIYPTPSFIDKHHVDYQMARRRRMRR